MISKRVIVQKGNYKGRIGVIVAVEGKNCFVQVDEEKPFRIKKTDVTVVEGQ